MPTVFVFQYFCFSCLFSRDREQNERDGQRKADGEVERKSEKMSEIEKARSMERERPSVGP